MEKLVQVRVEEHVKDVCDRVFGEDGMTTQQAVKTFLYQIAKSGRSPFDRVFVDYASLTREPKLTMVAEETPEYKVERRKDGE